MTSRSRHQRKKTRNIRPFKFTLNSVSMNVDSMKTDNKTDTENCQKSEAVTNQPLLSSDNPESTDGQIAESSTDKCGRSALDIVYKSSTQVKLQQKTKTGKHSIEKLATKQQQENSKITVSSSRSRIKSRTKNTLPHLNIPNLVHRQRTSDLLKTGVEGHDILMPASKVERRVTKARNTMYGNFLRQSTKKLQDDLRQTMRTYSTEKQQLLRHLASLRHEMDGLQVSRSSSPTSTTSTTDASTGSYINLRKPKRYFHAPNVAAHKIKKSTRSKDKKNVEGGSEKKPKDGILKLPSINETHTISNVHSHRNSEWDSGQQISLNNLPPIDPPEGIAAAKALLKDTYNIPKIDDPMRRDYTLSSQNGSMGKDKEKKKVQFSERDQINVITPSNNRMKHDNVDESDSKNYNTLGDGNDSTPQQHKRRGSNSRKHYLPPLDLGNRKKILNPKETEDHKMLYISIKDPEIRTKTLSEILHAVRLRMQENEQHLRFGEIPRQNQLNNTYEFLMSTSLDSPSPTKSERGNNNSRLGVPQNTAARLGRRSNATQLQNYLRKMSKSRRMIEHMEAEEYRLAHIIGHKELMAVTRNSNSVAG